MKTQRELLKDFQQNLDSLREQVNEEISRLDQEGKVEQDFGLLRSLIRDLDDRRQRQEYIQSLDPGTRTFVPPTGAEFKQWERKSNTREERMGELRRSLFRVWDEGTSSYIHGRYYASVLTTSAALEAVLKHELEKEEIDYGSWDANLDTCVSKARHGDIIPHGGEVSEAAGRVVDIRNDVAHFNAERFFEDRMFADRAEMDRMRPIDDPDHPSGTEIQMWGDAAQTVIEDVYLIINHIYEDEM